MRVVVDVNLYVSAFLWGGVPEDLLLKWQRQSIPLYITNPILAEVETTFAKPKPAEQIAKVGKTPSELLAAVKTITRIVELVPVPEMTVRDRNDQMLLEAAVGGNATHLITGDKDLLILGQFRETRSLTAAEFLPMIGDP